MIMGARGVVVIDLTEEADGMEKKEVKKEDHTCRCEVCHCGTGAPGGCEAGAIRLGRLMLLAHACPELRGKWDSGRKKS